MFRVLASWLICRNNKVKIFTLKENKGLIRTVSSLTARFCRPGLRYGSVPRDSQRAAVPGPPARRSGKEFSAGHRLPGPVPPEQQKPGKKQLRFPEPRE